MEKIKGLAIDLDLDHLSVDRGLRGLKDNLRTVNSEMKRNMSSFDRGERSVHKYETRLHGLNRKLEVQKVAVAEAKKEYEKMVEQHGKNSVEAQKAAREYNNQAAALNNLERYIDRTKSELQKFEREQRIANSGWTKFGDKLEETSDRLKTAGERMGRVGNTLTNKITKPAVGAATALASLAVYKGVQRLIGIDTAEAQLKALGHEAKEVEQIMDAALNSVRGTSHGMDEAATTAASAVAAGVDPVKDLERYLSLAADTASVANVPFAEMGTIFNKVQTTGKAQNDVLQQLSERGIPIYQYLAETIGKSTEEIQKLASDGKIGTKDFLKAVEENIGGAAQVIGEESFAAAWKNIGADISRIGANFLDSGADGKGFFSTLKPMLVDFRKWLERAEDSAADLGVRFGQSFQNMVEKAKDLKKRYDELTPAQQDFVKKVLLLGPAVAVGIGPAITLFSKLTLGVSGVLSVTGRLSKAIGVARGTGLAAGLASLGPGAVAGVAVAGLVAVGATINHLRTKADEAYTSQLKVAEGNLQVAKSHTNVLNEQMDQMEQTSELIEQTKEQMEVTDDLVTTFENLTDKSKLSKEELGEFLTIQTELEHTKSPQRIAEMEERMEELRKKSGLSKDEFNKLLESNSLLADQFPKAGEVIDDYGNVIMDTTGKLREMTQAELERMQLQIYNEMVEDLRAVNGEIENYHDLLGEVIAIEDGIQEYRKEAVAIQEDIKANEDEIKKKNEELLAVKELMQDANLKEWWELDRQRGTLELQIAKIEEKNTKNQNNLDTVEKTLSTEEKTLAEKTKQRDMVSELIDKNNTNYSMYLELLNKQYDINVELGKENEAIDEAIKKRQEEITKIEEKIKKEGDSNGKLKESIDRLKTENSQLEDLKGKLSAVNSSLDTQNQKYTDSELKLRKVNEKFAAAGGLTDNNIKKADIWNDKLDKNHTKDIKADDNGTIEKINKEASKPISKTINFIGKGLSKLKFWEKGTPPQGHPGGDFVAGEKGTELVKLPSGRSFLTPNVATFFPNMPKGTHVIPNRETKRIMKNAQHYANGTRNWASALGNSEFARLLTSYSSESNVVVSRGSDDSGNNRIVDLLIEQNNLLMQLLNKDTNPIIDARSLGKGLEPIITETQNRKLKVRDTFA
ncbi:tape measure protein [Gracilibacillus dipsosauri]|uniref:tape measure protein n=1 Tax=Gracilibacillus dipsosauri TaxID=178340 RepID=UPI00240931E3